MLRSSQADLSWPALVHPGAVTVHGFLTQLQQSQWFKPARLKCLQARQLAARLNHAARHSAFHVPWLAGKTVTPDNAFEILASLPILQRQDLQSRAQDLFCPVPAGHGKVGRNLTSGSTGQPVTVHCTDMAYALRSALSLRGHFWHGVDLRKSICAIRGLSSGQDETAGQIKPNWGGVTALLYDTGPSAVLNITTPLAQQAAWLTQHRPQILMTYPSNLRELIRLLGRPWPELEKVLTISEALADDLRQAVVHDWGLALHDKYSSEELGNIAIECPHGQYHVSEHLLLEVLRDDGTPCAVGETGRVVVTDTYNFATALIRYDIRDHAQVGAPCACGRGLPSLNRIAGRVRNILTLPDGRRFWPLFGLRVYGELAPLRQFQFIQTALDELQVRLVSDRPLTEDEIQALSDRIRASVDYPMKLRFERVEGSLTPSGSTKFEEFRSLVGAAA